MILFESEQVDGGIVITDTASGLQWTKSNVTGKKWLEALEYCENLTFGGNTDWRLPNINELISIMDYAKYSPATVFPDIDNITLWSSTSKTPQKATSSSTSAWKMATKTGLTSSATKTSSYNVMCVRN